MSIANLNLSDRFFACAGGLQMAGGNVPLLQALCLGCNCPAQFVRARPEEVQVLFHSIGRLGGEPECQSNSTACAKSIFVTTAKSALLNIVCINLLGKPAMVPPITYIGTTANLNHPSALAYVALNHSAPASESNDALGGPIGNFVGLLAPSSADDFLLRSRRSASISDRRLQPPSSRKELNRLRARAWQETMAEIPTASPEGEPSRLR